MNTDKHGTLTGYTFYKCRCNSCVTAWREYQASYHQKRKSELLAMSAARYARNKKKILARKKKRYETLEGRVKATRDVSARRARLVGNFVEHIDRECLVERDGACKICGGPIDSRLIELWVRGESPRTSECPSTDHIIPLSKGGEHSYENCQLAHFGCNLRKHAKT